MGSKRFGVVFGAIALALLSCSGAALYGTTLDTRAPLVSSASPESGSADSFSLIIEPQDGMAPVEQLIESASSSIDIVMYEFEDARLEKLLAQEAQKGIVVRVILDNGYFGAGSSANEEAFDYLRSSGAQVHWSPQYFALTHEKALVVDTNTALIMSFNFTPQYYKSDRDFGVLDTDVRDVAAIEQAFDSDWNGQPVPASNGDELVWSPNARQQILSLISSATSSIEIYNEEMQDPRIISELEASAARGVDVEIDMSYADTWKQAFQRLSDSGVHVRTYAASAPIYIHAKAIIADGKEAFVGSENFSSTSLDQNRELGILVSDPNVVASLQKTFAQDWQGATPFLVQ